MEDSDLALLAFIIAAGTSVATLWVLGFFVPEQGIVNVVIASTIGIFLGFLYFFGSKRMATGYFKLPDDLKELHKKVKKIEEYKP